jgi:hypothetical protein
MLEEFCRVTGYHRKAAVRLLREGPGPAGKERRGRPVTYGPPFREALEVAWEALDRPCGKRLQPFLPDLIAHLERHGELSVDEEVRGLMGQVSAATVDRLLRRHRLLDVMRPVTQARAEADIRREVVVRTFGEWQGVRPGELQADLVMHCGESTAGKHLVTLTAVDVASGWCQREAVQDKTAQRVGSAVHRVRMRLPFPLRSIHTDNGGEFVNRLLVPWCRREGIRTTRGRPWLKNDQAWVEQRNDTAVRRLVGYDRYSSAAALAQLQRVYAIADDYANFFQPVAKLVRKERDGARVTKHYDVAKTPYQRLLMLDAVEPAMRQQLEARYLSLNPMELRRKLSAAVQRLFRLADPAPLGNPFLRQAVESLR